MKVKKLIGKLGHERLVIKNVPDVHEFLNKQFDNTWSLYDGELKPGTYAFAGGRWLNVKTIDSSLLSHI